MNVIIIKFIKFTAYEIVLRVCETISIIKMLTISKNLVWPRDLESFKGGNFNTLSLVDCYVQICNGTDKRGKICNKVLNMNWDYVHGKKTQKENKNKQTKRKQINKNKQHLIW
jgi:uncharacterized cupredoxin-like copper-binding protein